MNPVQHLMMLAVRLYRCTLSPLKTALLGPWSRCRFTPSCSEYALEALKVHGACRGSWLALRRLARCHPWGDCGWDPVPAPERPANPPPGRETQRRASPAPAPAAARGLGAVHA